MKSVGRLAMIIDALTNAYDIVVMECGPANAEAVRSLMSRRQSDIVISVGRSDRDLIEDAVSRFIDAGYEDIVLMMARTKPARAWRHAGWPDQSASAVLSTASPWPDVCARRGSSGRCRRAPGSA